MRRLTTMFLTLTFIAAAAAAQLSPKYLDFGEGPARHLMTKAEMKQWQSIHNDADAQAFIDLFWAKRDPTPNTPRNEFREDFQARVAFADQNFGGSDLAGSMTDRGKVFILLGPPEQVSGRAGAPSISSLGGGTAAPTDAQGGVLVPRPIREENRQVWTYAHDKKPKYISQSDFVLVFLDVGHNDWQLAHSERTNPDAILLEAVNKLIVNPKLTKAPVFGPVRATAFKNEPLKTAYDQFRAGDKATIGPATLTEGEYVSDDGVHFIAAQMYVPSGNDIKAGQKLTFLSVVEDKDGKIVDVREDPVTMLANGDDAYADKSIELEPGSYNVTFALADGPRILAASRTAVAMQGLDASAPGLSPLLLASSVYPLKTTWYPTDPFTFGGFKVVPKGDAVFPTKGDLWYFVEVRNPGIADTGDPNLRVKVDISGKTAKGPVAMNIPIQDAAITKLLKEKNRYALGMAIPLEGFVPGDYTMKIHVTDTILGKDYDLEKGFRIRG